MYWLDFVWLDLLTFINYSCLWKSWQKGNSDSLVKPKITSYCYDCLTSWYDIPQHIFPIITLITDFCLYMKAIGQEFKTMTLQLHLYKNGRFICIRYGIGVSIVVTRITSYFHQRGACLLVTFRFCRDIVNSLLWVWIFLKHIRNNVMNSKITNAKWR